MTEAPEHTFMIMDHRDGPGAKERLTVAALNYSRVKKVIQP